MSVIGDAWISIKPLTTDFDKEVEAKVSAAMDAAAKAADEGAEKIGQAGRVAGDEYAEGVTRGAAKATAALDAAAGESEVAGARIGKAGEKASTEFGDALGVLPARTAKPLKAVGDDAEKETGRISKAAEKEGGRFSKFFNDASTLVGGSFMRIGEKGERAGIAGAAGLSKMGEGMKEAESKGSGLSSGLASIGKLAVETTAAGFVVVGGEAVNLANKYESATTTLAAQAGITVAAATTIGKAFTGTAGTTIYSAQEMMAAYSPVAAQLGQVEGHALSGAQALKVMAAAGDLAEASGTKLNIATGSLGKVMQTYHLGVSQAAGASDVLFNVSRLTNTSVDGVAQAVDRLKSRLGIAAPSLSDTGALMDELAQHGVTGTKGISTMSGALNSLLAAGVKTTMTTADVAYANKQAADSYALLPKSVQPIAKAYAAGTLTAAGLTKATKGLTIEQSGSLKAYEKLAAAAQNASKGDVVANLTKAQKTVQELGLHVYTASGKFVGMRSVIEQLAPKLAKMSDAQKETTERTLFGASAAQVFGQVLAGGTPAYDKAAKAVGQVGSAHAAAEKQSKTFSHQMEILKGGAEDYGIKLGLVLIPWLEKFVLAIVHAGEWLNKHRTILEAVALVVGVVLVAALYAWISGLVVVAAAELVALAPILLIVAAVALLAIGIIELYKHWHEIWGDIKDIVKDAVGWIVGRWHDVTAEFDKVVGFIKAHSPEIAAALVLMLGPVGLFLAAIELIATHWQDIETFAVAAFHAVEHAVSDAVDWIKAHWELLLAILTGPVGAAVIFIVTHWHQILDVLRDVLNDVVTFFTGLPQRIIDALVSFEGLVRGFLQDHLIGPVTDFLTTAVTWFLGLPVRIIDALAAFDALVRGFLQDHFIQPIEDFLVAAVTWFEGLPQRIITGLFVLGSLMTNFWTGTVMPTVTSFISAVVAVFTSLPHQIMTALASLATDVGGIFTSMLGDVRTPVNFIIDGVNILDRGLNDIAGLVGIHHLVSSVPHMATGGFKTGGPALVGEGNPNYPEYVLATDPAYRARNVGLLKAAAGDLGLPMLAEGGILGGIGGAFHDVTHGIAHAAGDLWHDATSGLSELRKLTAEAFLRPLFAAVNAVIPAVPPFLAGVMPGLEHDVTSWVAGPVKNKAGPASGIGTPVGAIPVGDHLNLIVTALRLAGVGTTGANEADVNTIVVYESGWNPNAINLTDSNAAAGHPSQGLMQTVPGTFARWALAPYNVNIDDPLSNLVAGIRYAVGTYGSLGNVPGIVSLANGAGYRGYDRGGILWPGDTLARNASGLPELILTNAQAHNVFGGGDSKALTGEQAAIFGGASTARTAPTVTLEAGAVPINVTGLGDTSPANLAVVQNAVETGVAQALRQVMAAYRAAPGSR